MEPLPSIDFTDELNHDESNKYLCPASVKVTLSISPDRVLIEKHAVKTDEAVPS